MPIKPLSLYTQFYTSNTFTLRIKHTGLETKMIMRINNNIINTKMLPRTLETIKKTIPSVLRSTCYNDNNTPFYKEVLRTEIGHLFEHILIEYMCLIKMQTGALAAEYSGVTKWNWVVHPVGSFHITVSSGKEDLLYFSEAIKKTISLTEYLFQIHNQTSIPTMTDSLLQNFQIASLETV